MCLSPIQQFTCEPLSLAKKILQGDINAWRTVGLLLCTVVQVSHCTLDTFILQYFSKGQFHEIFLYIHFNALNQIKN